ncbi:hypothetical protein B0H11DRAFT_2074575 [Mycena galericulata]|nr:hypothetical protein B0H11DRAFT_2074575 [Mycena galericulata]
MPLPIHVGTFLIFSGSTVNFGSLGFCILNNGGNNSCTHTAIGYKIADEIAAIGISPFDSLKASSLHGLTEGFILHQIAAGIAGVAFLLAVFSHRLGYILASMVAFVAFLFSLAVLIIDFITFGSVKDHVDSNGGHASWGNAIWMVLAATIVLLSASITTCFA